MVSLSLTKASELLLRFEDDWANLRDEMESHTNDGPLIKALVLLCTVRQQLCTDRRLLRWYLLVGLKSLETFYPATAACAEWEGKSIEEINEDRFRCYNNWTITTRNRWSIVQMAAGNHWYDEWSFKHPMPPTMMELQTILEEDYVPTTVRVGATTHDLDWYYCS